MRPRLMSRGKTPLSAIKKGADPASMRPRLMSRGKNLGAKQTASLYDSFNAAAAHEPRKDILLDDTDIFDEASMRPRLMSRGKAASSTATSPFPCFNAAAAHEPRKAPRACRSPPCSAWSLQCGRGS